MYWNIVITSASRTHKFCSVQSVSGCLLSGRQYEGRAFSQWGSSSLCDVTTNKYDLIKIPNMRIFWNVYREIRKSLWNLRREKKRQPLNTPDQQMHHRQSNALLWRHPPHCNPMWLLLVNYLLIPPAVSFVFICRFVLFLSSLWGTLTVHSLS